MGNINDYGLTQMKGILRETSTVNDAAYLLDLQQAVYDISGKVGGAMVVTVTGSSYALTPAPAATSPLWNVIAHRAVYLYRQDIWLKFLREMEGLASMRDEIMTINRGETMRQLEKSVERAKQEYQGALSSYKRGASGMVSSMEEIETREDVT